MTIYLKEQLKRMRRERGNTQEDLAAHLGITVQAVSKWERGEGYPDITLLPAIASFYNASIDDLLGTGKIEKDRRIADYRNRSIELLRTGKSEEWLALWREAQKEFPNDLRVVYDLMHALMWNNKEEHADEIIECGERILAESTDSGLRSGAIQCLCFTYYDKGDTEAAKRTAEMATGYCVSINELMPRLLEGEEAVEYCQTNIMELAGMIGNNTRTMCRKGAYSPKDTIKAYRFVLDLYDLLYPDGNCGFYHVRYSECWEEMAAQYQKLGNEDEMFRCLEKAAQHAIRFDTIEEGFYTAFMVNRAKMSPNDVVKDHEENQSGLLLKSLLSESYDRWRTDERLLKIIENLRQVAIM